ncbi:nucleotidyl transferase AbiEii/AbiGii toxin family protein [Streptomyces sp. NBRC 109706]|uniref:nucleotidyl transferase AbiEii/AbiGii toxin family protein n=1 Tax=Streptomyces sp. NBRC 109706 TaxID=1550035 RepID=UPI00082E8C4F|nr:nucleotidyl transferase AbiEii/AbiGii toxin family protein [Streptomyces sp. NBRC 109706]
MTAPDPDPGSEWRGLYRAAEIPHTPLDEEQRQRLSLPPTLLPTPDGLRQPPVFDPALKQFANAYRAGEPVFEDAAARHAWHRARRTAIDLVLSGLAGGRWAGHLVLRGSVLLATWFGDAARDPGDLDFLVTPVDWAMEGPETAGLLDDLARDAEAAARAHGGVTIDAAGRIVESIWTYERVPGRRMVLPWAAPGTPGGVVQLDIVFNEPLPVPAERTTLRPLGEGPGSAVLGVTPGLSLAWKLLWLVTDTYPQGKDLYDAVLLAEHTPPSYPLVRDAFLAAGEEALRPPGPHWVERLDVGDGWRHFAADHPELAARATDFPDRLLRVLGPLLAEAARPGESEHDRWARWLAPWVRAVRARAEAEPASAVGWLSAESREGLAAATVIVRAILGPGTVGVEEALRAVLAGDERWRWWREHPEALPGVRWYFR